MRRLALLAALALVGACSAELRDGQFACGPAGECPDGWGCVSGFCYSSPGGGMDSGPGVDAGPDHDAGPGRDAGVAPGIDGGPCTCEDEGNACTTDMCVADVCMHTPIVCGSGEMCVGGACVCQTGLTNCPPDGCVNTLSNPMHCGVCGRSCTMGSCNSGTCGTCSPGDPCGDSNPCTDDVCGAGGACMHTPNSAACDDTNPCTTPDVCAASMCTSTPMNCDDGIACTVDSCAAGACMHPVAGGQCLIAGMCYAGGVSHPTNPCQLCNPAVSTAAWSAAPAGTGCNDGNGNTCDDACNGAGVCAGVMPSCNDSNPCTDDFVACGAAGNCDHTAGSEGAVCPGPSRGHCCNGVCRDFGNCCTMGGCGFGGQCAAACNSFSCCGSCGGGGTCGA